VIRWATCWWRGNCSTEGLERLALGARRVYLVTDPELVKPLLKADDADADKGRIMQQLRRSWATARC